MSRIVDKGNGKFQLIVDLGYLPTGRRDRRYKTVEARNSRTAKRMLSQFEAELLDDSRKIDQNIKFSSFVERWKKEYGRIDLDPNTFENYCYELDASITPFFQKARLAKIGTYDIVQYMNQEKRNGVGPYALEMRHRAIRSVFRKAKEWEVIKQDPSRAVKKPKIKRREKEVLNEKEIDILLDTIEKIPIMHQLMILIALTGGLRRGEVLGLDIDQDINYKNRRAHVWHSLQETKANRRRLKAVKSDSERVVIFSQFLVDKLTEYRKLRWKERNAIGDKWVGYNDDEGNKHFLLFSHPDGTPYAPHTVSQMWKRFVKRTGIKNIGFHDLRHSAATFWLSQGVKMKTVQKILGHHDITTTMNLYAHVYDDDIEESADVFDELEELRKKQKKTH
ncbi:site-specific integrase [Sporolactobacillus sp. THM7-7]|nr:site-specific integrase [Sporolactobacillus sp. THM7-7]